tara:strand:+ start:35 stop:769 length:735 start_codon:yes stop_codon:yes gene_type:complete
LLIHLLIQKFGLLRDHYHPNTYVVTSEHIACKTPRTASIWNRWNTAPEYPPCERTGWGRSEVTRAEWDAKVLLKQISGRNANGYFTKTDVVEEIIGNLDTSDGTNELCMVCWKRALTEAGISETRMDALFQNQRDAIQAERDADAVKRDARRIASESALPAPDGRVTVTGNVTSIKTVSSQWGEQDKMTVQLTTPEYAGSRVYVSVPLSVRDDMAINDSVEFKATFARQADTKFAFGKRPIMVA